MFILYQHIQIGTIFFLNLVAFYKNKNSAICVNNFSLFIVDVVHNLLSTVFEQKQKWQINSYSTLSILKSIFLSNQVLLLYVHKTCGKGSYYSPPPLIHLKDTNRRRWTNQMDQQSVSQYGQL